MKRVIFVGLLVLAVLAIPSVSHAQCPAIGADSTCGVIITLNPGGTATITATGQGPYDAAEDTLVGVVNNSGGPVGSITLSSTLTIFGFDGDGICAFTGAAYCSAAGADPSGYEGPDNTFSGINGPQTAGTVNFTTPLANGASTYFSLEEAVTAADFTVAGPQLYDPNEPGSVLVFPKFVRGTVAAGVPATEIEISVHCPIGLQPCAVPGTSVRLMGHWVCPGQAETQICKENNFVFTTTVEGTVSFNTEASTPPANFATVKVPAPLCPEGYLIVWAVDTRNRPIKFDGLVGDAIVRWNNHAAGSYKAIAIQADPALANNALLVTGNAGNGLIFDGRPGHYLAVTGTVMGSVKYDTLTPAADAPVTTTLTLLTLDTLSNRPNNEVFTDIDFYDANENVLSDSTNYTCWTETALSTIDPSLTRDFMSRKGFFVSLDATKVAEEGIADNAGPVSQLGLIDTQECAGSAACSENVPVTAGNNPTVVNHYAYRTDDDSVAVPTTFVGP